MALLAQDIVREAYNAGTEFDPIEAAAWAQGYNACIASMLLQKPPVLELEIAKCEDDLRKLRALPPYDYIGNLVAHDGIFANYIKRTYSEEVRDEAEKRLTKGDK